MILVYHSRSDHPSVHIEVEGVIEGWYPGSKLEMDEDQRSQKLTKFGLVKHVYPSALMKEMLVEVTAMVASRLPVARVLYWTLTLIS